MCDDELNDMEWTETDAMTDSAEPDADAGRVLLGVDLGTSRTAVMSSRGAKKMVPSVVGYPTDLIGVKLLGRPSWSVRKPWISAPFSNSGIPSRTVFCVSTLHAISRLRAT